MAQAAPEPSESARVETALPAKAFALPAQPRKLLIFDLNVNYGGHRSIPTANLAFSLMGKKTGAFDTVISREPSVFQPSSLAQFDAVFLNNTVGNLFEDPALRQSLVEFVYRGGGLLGVHGTSVAFTRWPGAHEDWPEFGVMLGARGANHRASNERVMIKLDDPGHPLNQPFGGQGFEYRDEFFRVHEPYSRQRVRVLLSIDTEKTDLKQGPAYGRLERADNDFALAWVRQYGRGRAFYCTIAHNPYVFWDAKLLPFYLAAVQFALGDLPAPTTPSGKLTPAIRAQEQLGWRLGLAAPATAETTLFSASDKAAERGLLFLNASDTQQVGGQVARSFDALLGPEELSQVRLKLDAAGVRLLAYEVRATPAGAEGWDKVFAFARKMGVEVLLADPPPAALDQLERLCRHYEVKLALRPRDGQGQGPYANPAAVAKMCQGRDPRLGVAGNLGAWQRSGLNLTETIRLFRERLFVLQIHHSPQPASAGQAAPARADLLHEALIEIRRLGIKPALFTVEYPSDSPATAGQINAFNQASLALAK